MIKKRTENQQGGKRRCTGISGKKETEDHLTDVQIQYDKENWKLRKKKKRMKNKTRKIIKKDGNVKEKTIKQTMKRNKMTKRDNEKK